MKITTQERARVADLLRGAMHDMYNDLYNDPTVEHLDQVLRACEEALTKVKQLRRWAKLTEENEAQPSVKQAIVALVKEELKGGNTMPRWLLGAWLKDLGTLVDEYPDWVKIVDSAMDMTW